MATVIREPEVTIALVSSDTLVGNKPQRILAIGQKLAGGTAVSGALVTQIQNDNSWDTLFGAKSMLSGQCRNVRRYNTVTRLDAIALDDNGSAVQATGTMTIAGTAATVAGLITFYIGSKVDYRFQIPVAVGDTPSIVATTLTIAINAHATVPVTCSNTAGAITITAENGGTVGNTIGLELSVKNVVGLSAVVATPMSGGLIDPSFTGLFDVIEDERYQTYLWAYTDDIDTIKNELDSRWNVSNNILDGVAFMLVDDTLSGALATLDALNSQSLCVFADEFVNTATHKGGAILEIPYATAAQIASISALRLTDGAAIGRFVIARQGGLDRFGSSALASLPFFNTPIPDLPLMNVKDGWTAPEQEFIKQSGGSIVGNNISNNEVLLGEVLTTYKTDVASNPDITFKYLEYVQTSSNIREFYFNNLKARFAQSRLTEGALIAGRAMANGAVIEAFCTQLYQQLANIVLVQDGETALKFYKQNLLVTLDLAQGKATVQMIVPIVTQLRVILATIQIAFTAEG